MIQKQAMLFWMKLRETHVANFSVERMAHLPELFRGAQYSDDEARKVLSMLKALTPREIISEPAKPD
jgi:hypothetical protein